MWETRLQKTQRVEPGGSVHRVHDLTSTGPLQKHGQLMPQRGTLPNQVPAGTTICLGNLNGIRVPSLHLYKSMPNHRKSPVVLAGLGFEEVASARLARLLVVAITGEATDWPSCDSPTASGSHPTDGRGKPAL